MDFSAVDNDNLTMTDVVSFGHLTGYKNRHRNIIVVNNVSAVSSWFWCSRIPSPCYWTFNRTSEAGTDKYNQALKGFS